MDHAEIPINRGNFPEKFRAIVHNNAMGELYYRKSGSDFIWDSHIPRVAERVDQIGQGILKGGEYVKPDGTIHRSDASYYKYREESLDSIRFQRLISTTHQDNGTVPAGTYIEARKSDYEKWAQASGPHSKLGMFYRRMARQLEQFDPKMLFTPPMPGAPVAERDRNIIFGELRAQRMHMEERDGGLLQAIEQDGSGKPCRVILYNRHGRITRQEQYIRYADGHTASWKKDYSYDRKGRLTSCKREESQGVFAEQLIDTVTYTYNGDGQNNSFTSVFTEKTGFPWDDAPIFETGLPADGSIPGREGFRVAFDSAFNPRGAILEDAAARVREADEAGKPIVFYRTNDGAEKEGKYQERYHVAVLEKIPLKPSMI